MKHLRSLTLRGDSAWVKAAYRQLEREGVPVTRRSSSGKTASLILSLDKDRLLHESRSARRRKLPTLFVWPMGRSGLAWMAVGNGCPCLECFEVLNPKMLPGKTARPPRRLPDELVGWIDAFTRRDTLPLGKVVVHREGEPLIPHEVQPVLKCPARLTDEGFRITP